MQSITVQGYVSKAAALAQGTAKFGEFTVELMDEDVARLSAEGRTLLLAKPTHMWDVTEPTSTAVFAAVEAAALKVREAQEKKQAALDAHVQWALAQPDSAWIHLSSEASSYAVGGYPSVNVPRSTEHTEASYTLLVEIAPIRERITRIEASPAYLAALESYEARKVEREREIEAKAKAKEDAKLAACAAIAVVAAKEESTWRAVADGYDCTNAVLDILAKDFRALAAAARRTIAVEKENAAPEKENAAPDPVKGAVYTRIDRSTWDSDLRKDRAAPSSDNFALRDVVLDIAKQINADIPVELGQWAVSRILRLDVCPHRGHERLVTCVLADFITPVGERTIIASLEDLACNHLACNHDSYDNHDE